MRSNTRYAKEWEKPTLTNPPELYRRAEDYLPGQGASTPNSDTPNSTNSDETRKLRGVFFERRVAERAGMG
jgi:hypothetical protein